MEAMGSRALYFEQVLLTVGFIAIYTSCLLCFIFSYLLQHTNLMNYRQEWTKFSLLLKNSPCNKHKPYCILCKTKILLVKGLAICNKLTFSAIVQRSC
jgi:hypothetical protein